MTVIKPAVAPPAALQTVLNLIRRIKTFLRMKNKRIAVKSSAGEYSIVCGKGVLRDAANEIRKLGKFSLIHVVSSPKVWRAVGKSVQRALGLKNIHATHLMDDAESAKNLFTLEKLERSLVHSGIDRHALIIAVGGGVVGDVAGFAASTCQRGVSLVQIPTTLISQVDSAVGGKTGVNLPEGKNLVGTFYPARLVLVDSAMLKPLPERQYRGGLAEVIKYGVIADAKLFAYLEKKFRRRPPPRSRRPRLHHSALAPNQSPCRQPRRTRIRPPRNPEFRPHLRPRPRNHHELQNLPARRSRSLGNDGRRSPRP